MMKYSQYSDTELGKMLRDGDHNAFEEIYWRFHSILYVHAYRKLNDREATNDLLQEIFFQLWEKRSAIIFHSGISAYLYSTIRNKIINQFTHKQVEKKYLVSIANYLQEDHDYADHKVRERDLRELIERELANLPDTERAIFEMSRNQNLSYREIAATLELSEEAVKSRMKRTLKILRKKLGFWAYWILIGNYF